MDGLMELVNGSSWHRSSTRLYWKLLRGALRPRSLNCPMYNRHTHADNVHPHPQTETNEHTKRPSKLFNHKRKVAEGMLQGLVFNSIDNKQNVVYTAHEQGSFWCPSCKIKKNCKKLYTLFGTMTKGLSKQRRERKGVCRRRKRGKTVISNNAHIG